MDMKMKATLACCIATCIMTVTIPLVSEITNRGRGGKAGQQVREELIYVPVRVPDNRSEMPLPDSSETSDGVSDTEPHTVLEVKEDTEPENIHTSAVTDGSQTKKTTPDDVYTVRVLDKKTQTVTEMPLEEYIVGVVSAEMAYTFNAEALKAQAVAARSYCIYKIVNGSDHDGADVCTSYSHCASYVSKDELTEKYGEKTANKIITKITKAVEDTAGQIITYKGTPALALFHSSSRGHTESAKNVWGGNLPYLVSVPTPEQDSVSTVTVTDAKLSEVFGGGTVLVSASAAKNLTSVKNDSGRQETVSYFGKELKAKSLRTLFGLKSCDFEFERVEGGWMFTVHGYGHGVGMSQYGANEMANSGCKYGEILTHYYTGVTLTNISKVPSAVKALDR